MLRHDLARPPRPEIGWIVKPSGPFISTFWDFFGSDPVGLGCKSQPSAFSIFRSCCQILAAPKRALCYDIRQKSYGHSKLRFSLSNNFFTVDFILVGPVFKSVELTQTIPNHTGTPIWDHWLPCYKGGNLAGVNDCLHFWESSYWVTRCGGPVYFTESIF